MYDLSTIFPILAACSVVLLVVIKVYFKIREFLPITVNCWFCNKSTKVAYHEFNSWVCGSCDQYNGFTQDGGYNKVITAQHDEYLNISSASSPRVKYKRQHPTLCGSCNINQELKVMQLSSFQPVNQDNYNYEIELYSQQLEKVYGLCEKCDKAIAEIFEKEKTMFLSCFPKSTDETSKQRKKSVTGIKNKFVHYGLIVGCVPQVIYAIFYHRSVNEFAMSFYKRFLSELNIYSPKLIKDSVQNLGDLFTLIGGYGGLDYKSLDFVFVGLCIFVYAIEFLRSRTVLNLLNLAAWSILFSLKYFSANLDEYIVVLQGVTAVIFLVLNKRNGSKKSVAVLRKQPSREKDEKVNVQSAVGCKQDGFSSVTKSMNSAFTAMGNLREPPKPTCFQNLSVELDSYTKISRPNNPVKHTEDFGISSLHLGNRKRVAPTNHLTAEPATCYKRSTDNIWNRSPILSPPRLNIDNDRCYTLSPTPSCSQTSGVGTSTPTPKDYNDREFDRYSDVPTHHNQVLQPNFCTPYDPMYQQQLAMSPYTYYQFAMMFHRMYTPPPFGSEFSNSNSNTSSDKVVNNNSIQCLHSKFYTGFISMIVVTNFLLVSLISYKEFFNSSKT